MESTNERVPTLEEVQTAIDRGDRREALIRSELMAVHGSRSFWNYDYWSQRIVVMIMNNELNEAIHSLEVAIGMPRWEQKFTMRPLQGIIQNWIDRATRPIHILEFLDKLQELCEPILSKGDVAWLEKTRGKVKLNEAKATFFHSLSPVHRHTRGTQERLRREAENHFAAAQAINCR